MGAWRELLLFYFIFIVISTCSAVTNNKAPKVGFWLYPPLGLMIFIEIVIFVILEYLSDDFLQKYLKVNFEVLPFSGAMLILVFLVTVILLSNKIYGKIFNKIFLLAALCGLSLLVNYWDFLLLPALIIILYRRQLGWQFAWLCFWGVFIGIHFVGLPPLPSAMAPLAIKPCYRFLADSWLIFLLAGVIPLLKLVPLVTTNMRWLYRRTAEGEIFLSIAGMSIMMAAAFASLKAPAVVWPWLICLIFASVVGILAVIRGLYCQDMSTAIGELLVITNSWTLTVISASLLRSPEQTVGNAVLSLMIIVILFFLSIVSYTGAVSLLRLICWQAKTLRYNYLRGLYVLVPRTALIFTFLLMTMAYSPLLGSYIIFQQWLGVGSSPLFPIAQGIPLLVIFFLFVVLILSFGQIAIVFNLIMMTCVGAPCSARVTQIADYPYRMWICLLPVGALGFIVIFFPFWLVRLGEDLSNFPILLSGLSIWLSLGFVVAFAVCYSIGRKFYKTIEQKNTFLVQQRVAASRPFFTGNNSVVSATYFVTTIWDLFALTMIYNKVAVWWEKVYQSKYHINHNKLVNNTLNIIFSTRIFMGFFLIIFLLLLSLISAWLF